MTRLALGALAALLSSASTMSVALAADRYWDPNGTAPNRGGTGSWDLTPGEWSNNGDGTSGPYTTPWDNDGIVDGTIDNAIFGGPASGIVTLGAPITAQTLTFETSGYTLNGGTLTLGGVTPGITIGNLGVTATIGSVLSGTAGLTVAGSNTSTNLSSVLVLTGTNTFTGGITLNAAALSFNGDAALGPTSNNISTAGYAALTNTGSTSLSSSRTVTIGSGSVLTISRTGTGDIGGALYTGSGALTIGNNVSLTNNNNSYTGQTTFSAGTTVTFSSIGNVGGGPSALGAPTTAANGTINANNYLASINYTGTGDNSDRNWNLMGVYYSGQTLINAGSGTLTLSGDIAESYQSPGFPGVPTYTFTAQSADMVLSGVISSSIAVDHRTTFNGGGVARTITLGGANTYTSATNIGSVTLRASTLADIGTASSLGTATVLGTSSASINVTNNGVLSYTGTGASTNRTFSLDGATGISNDGTGALNLTGTMAFATGGSSPDSLTLGGSYAGTNILSGALSGVGNLVMNGGASSVWMLTAANTFTGPNGSTPQSITVQSGTLRAGNAQAFGLGLPTVTVNGGTLDLGGYDTTIVSLAGTGGTVALGANSLTINGTTSTSYAGNVTGTGGLIKRGTGTLTLSGTNTYTGPTVVNAGTLALNFGSVGAPTSNIISSSSALTMSGGNLTMTGAAGLANSQTFSGMTATAGTSTISVTSGAGGTATLNLGAISSSGGLVNFVLPASGAITTSNADGALGWATVSNGSNTDYAQVIGGNITAFNSYTNQDNAALWASGNVVSDAGGAANSPYFGMVGSNVQLGGLKYTAAAASTVTIGAGQTLGVDGTIIVASSTGNANQTITGGTLTGAVGGGTLGVLDNGTGTFIIGSTIADNGGATGLTVAGTGTVNLTNAGNTYSGATTISGGTLWIGSIANGGAASTIGASSSASSNLVLANGTLFYSGGTATTDRGFTLINGGSARTINISNGAANLTFAGLVTSPDDAGLIKAGPGTLTLSNAANSYTGITTVSGGILSVGTLANGGAVSGIGASSNAPSNLVFSGGGTLQYTGATTSIDRGFTLGSGGGGFDVANAGTTLTVSGVGLGPAGSGALLKNGAGTLILSATNTYVGGTTVNAGTLQAGSTRAFGGGAGGAGVGLMTVNTGATLALNGYNNIVGGLSGGGSVTLGSATLTTNASGTFGGGISGNGGFTSAAGTQTMSGCGNSYTGVTTLLNGNISTDCLANGGQASGIGASSSASANLILNNGTLTYSGGSVTIDRGFTLAATSTINVSSAPTILGFTGSVIGAGGLTKSGSGTLVLSGANTMTGGTSVNAGTLRAGSVQALSTGAMTVASGATLDLNGFNNSFAGLNGSGNVALGSATLSLGNNFPATFSGTISGTGGVARTAASFAQQFNGCNNTYTGVTSINGSTTLAVDCLADGGQASGIGAATASASNLVLSNGGVLQYNGAGSTTNRLFSLGTGGGTLDASGTGAVNFTNTGAIAFTGVNTSQTLTLTGSSTGNNSLAAQLNNNGSGTTSLTKTGTGTWILNNPGSTYTGVTTIAGGVLGVDKLANGGQASSLGMSSNAASNLVIGSGSTLRYTGAGDATDRLFTLSTGTSFIESSGTGAIVFSNTGSATYSGSGNRTLALGGTNTGMNTMGGTIINGPGGVTTLAKNDAGTWVLTGNNTFTGNTVINDGNLIIGNGGTTGNAGAGNVIVNAATSTLSFNRSDTFNFTGTLSGPGSIAQIGTGTTVLTSMSSSIGATRVNAGTLQVNGMLTTPTIAMNGSGILTINGTVQASGPTPALVTGDAGASTINVAGGGTLYANGNMGGGSDTVNLTGTLNTGAAALSLGDGDDVFVLNDGGTITGTGIAGGNGTDTLRVRNAVDRTLDGGQFGTFEALNKQLTGLLTLTGDHSYSAGTTVEVGELRIGNGGASGTLAGPIALLNSSALSFNRAGTLGIAGAISGSGSVTQMGPGTTILSGNDTYSGPTDVDAGTLLIDGIQSGGGLITVASGATLGGNGTAGGSVLVESGGFLAPGAAGNTAGTLTIAGGLTLESGSTLAYSFGQPNVVGGANNDHTVVNGDLDMQGADLDVSVTPGGTFGPGVYRVITYTGALIDNSLSLGTVPPATNLFIQTSVANQVNLVNTFDTTLRYWDGAPAGNKNNGVVNGGDGVWQNSTGNDNWTDENGVANAPWSDGQFAIFTGAPGTVTVDNSLGAVSASGMQFLVSGYEIAGQPLTLVPYSAGTNAIIRVGSGAPGDGAMVATISAELTGTAGLTKTDAGRLILNAANTYTGMTQIEGGVVQVSAENQLGANAGMVLQGGTLNTTASFTLGKTITLNGGGGALDVDGGTTLTATGTIGGAGALTKLGAGTLVLTGSNTYSGGTNFNAGVVSISANDNLGTGPLTFNGGTLQSSGLVDLAVGGTINAAGGTIDTQPGNLTIAGNLAGAGALSKTGPGTLTLTGTNSYAGGTTVSSGVVELGSGGSTGSITGNVALSVDTALHFNRNNTYAFDGVISGAGSVAQLGGGTTILTGTNTYAGTTSVVSGTLLVNGDQSGATGPTTVGGLLDTATLGGTGTIGGDVTLLASGILAPGDAGAPGTLTINGTLTLESGSALAYSYGQPNVVGGANNDHTIVGGDLDMQGATIDVAVTAGGTFGPGVYRVITYGGDLIDDQLALGTVPPDTDLYVDTATAGQVNLLNRFGGTLTYWDGGLLANKNNGIIDGGDGVWQNQTLVSNINWTDNPSTFNAQWTDDAFAIFQGSAGAVGVDNSNGAVTASGMQFLVSGYEITGQPLTLVPYSSGTNAIIRVGSGAPGDETLTATISATLAGTAGLTKTDAGRLVLTSVNGYSGATVIEGGVVEVAAESALGTNTSLVLQGGRLNTTASFALGKNISLLGPGGGLDVDGGTTLELSGLLSGSGGLVKTGTGTLLQSITGNDTHTGPTTVAAGTLLAGNAGVLSAASAYTVNAGATLDLDGYNQTIASLNNAGDVRLEGAPGTTLTLINDYVGSGGTIYINTQLGNDASPTDRLMVGGGTSGTSILDVTNVGGAGAPTVEGIKVVDVAGASNGTFTLQGDYVFEGEQAVVGGAYAYRLYKNGVATPTDGDWYLRSSLIDPDDPDPEEPPPPLYQPGVPLYEAYANVLQSFQKLETLQQRVGNRSWQPGAGVRDVGGEEIEGGALWGRIATDHKGITPDVSTAGITYDVTNWRIEAGSDGTLSETESGKLVGGLTAFLGTSSAAVNSVYGDGSIASLGYGLGAGLTYYGTAGFYLDGQARVTGFDSTLSSATASLDLVDGNKGFGYALSLEAGQKVVLTDQASLTPQAQVAYSSVRFDDFTDAFGAPVSLIDGDSLVARIGLSADFEDEWENEAAESGRTHVYGIANLYYELLEGSDVEVGGTGFVNQSDPFWGGIGIGGSINWADDKYSIYGEALANTSLSTIGESYSFGVTGGMRAKW